MQGFKEIDKPIDPPTISYIECYKTTGRSWLVHTEEKARLAGMLSHEYVKYRIRRRASMIVAPTNYRRLENYAEETHVVVPELKKRGIYHEAYGKVIEITVYFKYTETRGDRTRTRLIEVRLYIPIPIHYRIEQMVTEDFVMSVITLAKLFIEQFGYEFILLGGEQGFVVNKQLIPLFSGLKRMDIRNVIKKLKVGIRYVSSKDIYALVMVELGKLPEPPDWCNGIARLPLYLVIAMVYDVNYKRTVGIGSTYVIIEPPNYEVRPHVPGESRLYD